MVIGGGPMDAPATLGVPVDLDTARLNPDDQLVSQLMVELLRCLCEAFAEAGAPVCFCCLYHGATVPPMDACDCACGAGQPDEHGRGGQAWVRLMAANTRQNTLTGPTACGAGPVWRLQLELGVYRCINVTEDPNCPDRIIEALAAYRDFAVLRKVVACCEALEDSDVEVNTWAPIGPAGGCAGSALQFTVIP